MHDRPYKAGQEVTTITFGNEITLLSLIIVSRQQLYGNRQFRYAK
jgi:hypothetical protein